MQLPATPSNRTPITTAPQFGSVRIKNTTQDGMLNYSITDEPQDGLFLNNNEKPLLQKPSFDITELYQKRQELLTKVKQDVKELPTPGTAITEEQVKKVIETATELVKSPQEVQAIDDQIDTQIKDGFKTLTKEELKQIATEIPDLETRKVLRERGLSIPRTHDERMVDAKAATKEWIKHSFDFLQFMWKEDHGNTLLNAGSKTIAVLYAITCLPFQLPISAAIGFAWGYLLGQ